MRSPKILIESSPSILSPKIPTSKFDLLYHRGGGLNSDAIPVMNHSSHEGCLLSCSMSGESDQAWVHIAKLGGLGLWHLTKTNGFLLLNYHRLSKTSRALILEHAQALDLVKADFAYHGSYFDSEMEGRVFGLHETYEEALLEIGENESRRIKRIPSFTATPRLLSYWRSRMSKPEDYPIGRLFVVEAAISYLVDTLRPDIDGMFWNDGLDPLNFSAPRVGLFQRTVKIASKEFIG